MSSALDLQRAQHTNNRRSWTTIPVLGDEFLVGKYSLIYSSTSTSWAVSEDLVQEPNSLTLVTVAVHELFVTIQEARARGIHITPQGTVFLSDLTSSVLRYLGPTEHEAGKGFATTHGAIDSGPPSPLYYEKTELEAYYPEGGLQAWLVVFGSWCGLLASIGMTNIMASFQTHISENQLSDYDESTIGWIFSLYAFLAFFGGIYVGPFFDKYGPRWLVFAGSMCVITDMMLLGLCTQYWQFLVVFGCLGGIGTALLFTPCIAAIGHWFKKCRGSATGIAVSSGALGGIVFPLVLEKLIPQIGFAWSTRIMGCIYIVLCATANILVKSRLPPIKDASANPDFKIFNNPEFAITVAGVFLLEWALFVPLAYIISYAMVQGFSNAMSYNILIFLNVGSFFGRILAGYIADCMGRYNTNIIVISLAIISIYGIWWPLGSTTCGLIVFALLFGFASGSNISLAPVCLGELCRTEEYGRYYATCFTVVSFGCLTGIPIAGSLISSAGGSYWALILFTGSCYVGALAAFTSARVLAKGWKFGVKY